MKKLLVIQPLAPSAMSLLDGRMDVSWEVVNDTSPSALIPAIKEADAVTVRTAELPVEALEAASKLKVIARHGVGHDNIPISYCTERKIPVALTVGANAVSVAEHTMYLILAAAKLGVESDTAAREGRFAARSELTGVELSGKTLLVAGCGRIGRELVPRARAFGLNLLIFDPYLGSPLPEGAERAGSLDEALPRSHILSLHLPLTSDTKNLIGERELRLLPTGAIVVNASRGGLVDEDALLRLIRSGHLMAAGLDTFETEPLPGDSPLALERRIVMSPHSAALTAESLQAMGEMTVQNALDGIDGKLVRQNLANPEALD